MKEFKTHQSSMLRDERHQQFVALPGVGGVWENVLCGRSFIHYMSVKSIHRPTFFAQTWHSYMRRVRS